MAVYRVERTRDYTVMSNYHLKDTTLSLKAKGLLSMFRQHHQGAGKGWLYRPPQTSREQRADHRHGVCHL